MTRVKYAERGQWDVCSAKVLGNGDEKGIGSDTNHREQQQGEGKDKIGTKNAQINKTLVNRRKNGPSQKYSKEQRDRKKLSR